MIEILNCKVVDLKDQCTIQIHKMTLFFKLTKR